MAGYAFPFAGLDPDIGAPAFEGDPTPPYAFVLRAPVPGDAIEPGDPLGDGVENFSRFAEFNLSACPKSPYFAL